MASNVLAKGKHFEVEPKEARIFDWQGQRLERGSWAVFFGFWVEVSADPVSPEIEAVVKTDIEAGKGSEIDHVLVSPGVAGVLFLEGRLTPEHFFKAQEGERSIRLSGIGFSGQEFDLLILPDAEIARRFGREIRMATINAQGEIV